MSKKVDVERKSIAARVFISCGQREKREKDIAQRLWTMLSDKGYEPYIATKQHTSEGFKENIFRKLEHSEYFLFIDFKREKLKTKKKDCRGSLFSHQELAVASYLGLDLLVFQEKGVEEYPGIMKFVMANPITFTSDDDLFKKIENEIDTAGWKPYWRRELSLSVEKEPELRTDKRNGKVACYYHLQVKNLHKSKPALNCKVLITDIKDKNGKSLTPSELSELKWKGTIASTLTIFPREMRHIDAFHVYCTSRDEIYLGINPYMVDSQAIEEEYTLKAVTEKLEITFSLYSDNFSVVKETFTVITDTQQCGVIKFYKKTDPSTEAGPCNEKSVSEEAPLTTNGNTTKVIPAPSGTITSKGYRRF